MNEKRMAKKIKETMPEATDEQVEAILALVSDQMQQQAEEHSEQVADLKKQLEEANTQIGKFEEMDIDKIKESAAAWQEKFRNGEKEWQSRLAAMRYEAAAKDAVADIKFSSNSAKRAFLADLKAKNLPLDGDRLTGFDDFLESYRETDPGAFVGAEPEEQRPGTQYFPGAKGNVSLSNVPEMDAAQAAFASKGVDFHSVKEFSSNF